MTRGPRLRPSEVRRRERIIAEARSRLGAAAEIGVAPSTLDEYVRRHRLTAGWRRRRDVARDHDEWRRLVAQGMRVSEVAERFHVSRHTVHGVLRRGPRREMFP
jgi:DNA invertase Pin-like site-specific DNA recombinase